MYELRSLGERIEYIQRKVGGSLNLDKLAEVSQPQQSRLIRNAVANPGVKTIEAIAKAGGVSLTWLITGEGSPDEGGQSASGYVPLPFIGSDGKPPFLFERNYLINVLGVPVDKAVMYHETSDCMEPEVQKDSYAVINTGVNFRDGMFLVRVKGHEQLYLRYLQFNPVKNLVEVSAANSQYKSFELAIDELEIVGTPVWFGAR